MNLITDANTFKKLRLIQQEILDEIVRICDKHGIRYFLVSGTLLGAVRHKGFIPWDEDIDIAMPRKDYNKFKAISKTELSADFFFQDCIKDPTYYLCFAKVRKNGTLYEESYTEKIDTHKGIFVDIFILDNAKKQSSITQHIQGLLSMMLVGILWVKKVVKHYKPKKPLHFICYMLSIPIPAKWVAQTLYAVMGINKNEDSSYYVNLTSRRGYQKQTMQKEKYLPAVKLEFEGKMYDAPRDWDYILTKIFGDYMSIPEEQEREYHKINRTEFDMQEKLDE